MTSDPTPIMTLTSVGRAFTTPAGDPIPILSDINLQLTRGETVAIIGRSGSGKSTLLNLLGLLDKPGTGEIRLGDVDPWSLAERKRSRLRGQTIGFVFQQFHLLDRRSALENVAMPLLNQDHAAISARFDRAADQLRAVGLDHRLESMPHVLSGGEQQRVSIARALVSNPAIVLADEPTGSLDTATGEQVMAVLMARVRDVGNTLVLVTHDESLAARMDRVLELANGVLTPWEGAA